MQGFSDHMAFKAFFQVLLVNFAGTWAKNVGRSIPGRGNSMLKGPEVATGK